MGKVTKLNYNALREGDIVSVSSWLPMGWITRIVTKGPVTHTGILIDIYSNGTFYMAEMIPDGKRGTPDMRFNSLNRILSPKRFWEGIYNIKRSHIYADSGLRKVLRNRIRKWKAEYDFPELLSHFTKKKDKNDKKVVCSSMVWLATLPDGVKWREIYKERGFGPCPNEIERDHALLDVVSWRAG